MSYSKKTEYVMIPQESFSVIRSCAGCNTKTNYRNTKRFRINANGNKLDVWLIYQCEKCKHTLNLTIYERQKATSIPQSEYMRFLNNDEELAEQYGRDFQFFQKNKAEVDTEAITYRFVKLHETEPESTCRQKALINIQNPYRLKIRPEKQIAEVLSLSRSQVKKLLEQEVITIEVLSPEYLSVCIENQRG